MIDVIPCTPMIKQLLQKKRLFRYRTYRYKCIIIDIDHYRQRCIVYKKYSFSYCLQNLITKLRHRKLKLGKLPYFINSKNRRTKIPLKKQTNSLPFLIFFLFSEYQQKYCTMPYFTFFNMKKLENKQTKIKQGQYNKLLELK